MRRVAATFAALAAVGVACVGRAPEPSGALQVFVAVRPGTGAEAAYVHLTGSTDAGQVRDAWHRIPRSADGFAGTLTVATGRYTLDARAFAGTPDDPATAPATFALESGAPVEVPRDGALVAVVLDPAPAAARSGPAVDPAVAVVRAAAITAPVTKNSAPKVTSVTAAPTTVDSADPAAVVALTGTATDKDGNPLTYAWTVAYSPALPAGTPPGPFSAATAATTSWVPPPYYQGTATITFTAKDPLGATGAMSVSVAVKPSSAPGNVSFTVSVNNFPDVSALTVADGQLAPLAQGVFAVTAVDPDGDPLSYAWSDGGCGGSFLAGASATATWVAPAVPGSCRITVTVRDVVKGSSPPVLRGGATDSSVTVLVGEPGAAFAPVFGTCASATPGPVAPGATVRFYVSAEEPLGNPPVSTPVSRFTWDDGTGRSDAFAPLAPPATDAVAWTAPPCGSAVAPLEVVVTATAVGTSVDPVTGQPLSTPFPFPAIRILCP